MRQTDAQLRALARGLVTGEFMLADLRQREWVMSLTLLLGGLKEWELECIGLVLVPMADHAGFHWINGVAPGCTMSARLVHVNDVKRFDAFITPMLAAVYGDG